MTTTTTTDGVAATPSTTTKSLRHFVLSSTSYRSSRWSAWSLPATDGSDVRLELWNYGLILPGNCETSLVEA